MPSHSFCSSKGLKSALPSVLTSLYHQGESRPNSLSPSCPPKPTPQEASPHLVGSILSLSSLQGAMVRTIIQPEHRGSTRSSLGPWSTGEQDKVILWCCGCEAGSASWPCDLCSHTKPHVSKAPTLDLMFLKFLFLHIYLFVYSGTHYVPTWPPPCLVSLSLFLLEFELRASILLSRRSAT